MYTRKTHDEYEVRGIYDGVDTCICTEDTKKEAMQRVLEYRENDPYVCCLRIVKHRVPNRTEAK